MKVVMTAMIAVLMVYGTHAIADEQTEKEVLQTIIDSNAYTKSTNKGRTEDYSKEGAVEFWSSGGMMHEVHPDDGAGEFDEYNVDVYHIKVTTLVPGKAAVAHYYSQGTMKPQGAPQVPNYFTRATQVFVKEDGAWKIRASHWSAVLGGSGTTQTTLQEED